MEMQCRPLVYCWFFLLCVLFRHGHAYFANEYGAVTEVSSTCVPGATVEKVTLYAQKDASSTATIARKALLVRYPHAQATIVICHGFMCDKFDAGFLRQFFEQGRYNFITFDFRAHGEDAKGQYCTFGRDEAFEVIAAARFVQTYPALKDKKRFAYGFSMGAVATIEAVSRTKKEARMQKEAQEPLFHALILDCPFDSSKNVIKHNLDNVKCTFLGYEFNIPGRWLLQRYAFHPYVQSLVKIVLKTVANMDPKHINTYICPIAPVYSVKDISVPTLFIHCKHDEKVSVDAIKGVFHNAGSCYKILLLTEGRRHFDSCFYGPEQYKQYVNSFFEKALSGSLDSVRYKEIIEEEPHFTSQQNKEVE
jgi:pimeloyl-ACP methyl ester carboxylesterase